MKLPQEALHNLLVFGGNSSKKSFTDSARGVFKSFGISRFHSAKILPARRRGLDAFSAIDHARDNSQHSRFDTEWAEHLDVPRHLPKKSGKICSISLMVNWIISKSTIKAH